MLVIAFWLLAIITVLSALAVVFLRDVFRAALFLVLCFVGVAGVYVMLNADFLAAAQILVYAGGIAVVIIMAIMFTHDVQQGSPMNKLAVPAFIVAALFLVLMVYSLLNTTWTLSPEAPAASTTPVLAARLLGPGGFILPVEIGATLLLAAILGAMVVAREK